MLYLYDNAIVDDLKSSFSSEYSDIFVKAVDPGISIPIAAQLQDDNISFPLICVIRQSDYQIDTQLRNFTAMHKGVVTVFDKENNLLYHEKSIPISLRYVLTIVGTDTAQVDELVRELIFKYTDMYFCRITLPYESDRQIRFGVEIDVDSSIERNSGVVERYSDGTLYETQIPLITRGCRLFSYTPVKLRNVQYDIEAYSKQQAELLSRRRKNP